MKTRKRILLLLCTALSLASPAQPQSISSVGYQGQTFALPRQYPDFRSYEKGHPHTFPEADLVRIERAITSAAFGPVFQNAELIQRALEALRFPGYGSFYANQLGRPETGELEFMYVEIPERGRNRYLVVSRHAAGFRVVADFIGPAISEITGARRASNGSIEFTSQDGRVLMRRNGA